MKKVESQKSEQNCKAAENWDILEEQIERSDVQVCVMGTDGRL